MPSSPCIASPAVHVPPNVYSRPVATAPLAPYRLVSELLNPATWLRPNCDAYAAQASVHRTPKEFYIEHRRAASESSTQHQKLSIEHPRVARLLSRHRTWQRAGIRRISVIINTGPTGSQKIAQRFHVMEYGKGHGGHSADFTRTSVLVQFSVVRSSW